MMKTMKRILVKNPQHYRQKIQQFLIPHRILITMVLELHLLVELENVLLIK